MTRTYFIRTRNRSRILETLVCQIIPGEKPQLAFGIARAPVNESSPSRAKGREEAGRRLSEALTAFQNGQNRVYRKPHAKRDHDGQVREFPHNTVGGVLALQEIVPFLNEALLGREAFYLVPDWAWKQDEEPLGNFGEYLDMLCKLRNCVERGKF
jgi:hypothetical protein